jgi:hypothetical protein
MNRREFSGYVARLSAAIFLLRSSKKARAAIHSGSDKEGESGRMASFTTNTSSFEIDSKGILKEVNIEGQNQISNASPSSLLSLMVDKTVISASRASWDGRKSWINLEYDAIHAVAVIAVFVKQTHITLELIGLRSKKDVELVLWGPYPIGIGDIVGEVVGVVRNANYAVGIQCLNPKTIGGYPNAEDDIPLKWKADDPGVYELLPVALAKNQTWRGDVARHTTFGSTLQAYTRNRNREKTIKNWMYKKFVVEPFDDGGLLGSKIALFACSSKEALTTLGEIEVTEDLPHPMINGRWWKVDKDATASFLSFDFGEDSIDEAIKITHLTGLKDLRHTDPFESWGHFKVKPELFPSGIAGFHTCVQKARSAGIGVGIHMLSNFITPNDAYVTPIPDDHLAKIGSSRLTEGISAESTEIPVEDIEFFEQLTTLNTVVIDKELIRYGSVSKTEPWKLLGCERGAWGTKAASHRMKDSVWKLADHPYKVFLTDIALSRQVAENIAEVCNAVGSTMLSFDGLEGNYSTGLGQYGCSLFTKFWYESLKKELQGHVITSGSRVYHFTWHSATRFNWGEPWWGSFRDSQALRRFQSQIFYARNFLPPMLGWFNLNEKTTLADIEWLLARAAGFDAGFTLVLGYGKASHGLDRGLGPMDDEELAILDAVKQWEEARMSRAFPEGVKPALQDPSREFHLQRLGADEWDLIPTKPAGLRTRIRSRQDG